MMMMMMMMDDGWIDGELKAVARKR